MVCLYTKNEILPVMMETEDKSECGSEFRVKKQ